MSHPTCLTHEALSFVQWCKLPGQIHPLKNLGKFLVGQVSLAILAATALVESVIYLALACLSVFFTPCDTRPCKFFATLWKSSAYTTFWALLEFLSFSANALYSVPERLLRMAVLQRGVQNAGCLESCMITTVCCTGELDREKAQRNKETLASLGAVFLSVTPPDRKATIDMMTLTAEALNAKIEAAGGRWERRQIGQQTVFAIVPPTVRGAEWPKLEEALKIFHWREEGEMMITCENAELIPQGKEYTQLFLNVNSPGVTYLMLMRRMGFYLGCKKNIC